MTIEKGQFAAIVGPSGCGKSTIIGLLERFYDIQTGTLRCDGTDITGLDVAEYRSYISLVAQEATLFQGMYPRAAMKYILKKQARYGKISYSE